MCSAYLVPIFILNCLKAKLLIRIFTDIWMYVFCSLKLPYMAFVLSVQSRITGAKFFHEISYKLCTGVRVACSSPLL